jgi:hypothetical protein
MTWVAITAVLMVMLAGVSRMAHMALRYGHLLVLRGPDDAARLYERQSDGRYAPLPLAQLPAALCRFTRGTPAEVRVRARGPRDGR